MDSGQAMSRPGKFIQVVSDLLHGYRVGVGMSSLMRALAGAHAELATMYDASAAGTTSTSDAAIEARRGHLWMLRQDLQAYVLLGDPAVRLPIRQADAAPQGSRSPVAVPMASAVVNTSPPAPPVTAAQGFSSESSPSFSAELLADLERYERAIAEVILNPDDLARVASDCEISRSRLADLVARYRAGGRAALAPALQSQH
jgi:hypothetical protein